MIRSVRWEVVLEVLAVVRRWDGELSLAKLETEEPRERAVSDLICVDTECLHKQIARTYEDRWSAISSSVHVSESLVATYIRP